MTDKSTTALVQAPQRRPSRRRITNAIHEMLDRINPATGATMEMEIAEKVVMLAAAGDLDYVKFVADRVEGRAVQAIEMSGPGGAPIEMINSETSAVDAARIFAQVMRGDAPDIVDIDEYEDVTEQSNVVRLNDHRDEKTD